MDGPVLFLEESNELGKTTLSIYNRRRFVINYKNPFGIYVDVVVFNMKKMVPLYLYKIISDDLANGFGVQFVSNRVKIADFRYAAYLYLKNINNKRYC
jgi:hypothetical protein